jgi:hypothetical protein
MVVSTPPVPPARARAGYHVHDGFYLRLGLGLGGGSTSISTNRDSAPNFELGGAGLAGNLWLGGTPWRGIAIGGLISLQGMNEGDTVVEGDETDEGMNGGMLMLAPFIDAFPDPQRGLHFGGALGLAFMSAKAKSKDLEQRFLVKDYEGGGLGLSGWIGYMGWVGQEWSLGGLLQLTGFVTANEEDGLKRQGTGGTLNISFSALYH